MIKINDLTFGYHNSGPNVLNSLNMELPENRIYGLLGKNGMGKSTLLYLICGLLRPQKGSVEIDGVVSSERHPEMLREVFIVTEEFELPAVRLSEYVRINAPFYPRFSEELMKEYLHEFELDTDPKLNALSMGQKKKVYMAFALAAQTHLLIMDEPTNGLDIPSKAQFRKVMARSMQDDRTVIISTHQVHDVETLIDHVLVLNDSKVILDASIDEICQKYVFEYRQGGDLDDVLYSEPTLQGAAVMAPRGDREETTINLELLFNAITQGIK